MHQQSKFWDRMAERYAAKPVADEESYQRKLQVTRGYLRPDMEVLEFGCGTGSTAIAHAPYVKHIRAIDISSKMLAIARGKAEAGDVRNVAFEQSSLDELDVPGQTFDAVIGHSILHLLENRDEAVSKVHAVLKPAGVFISSTACIGDFMKILKVVAPIGKFVGLLPLLRVFTAKDLEFSLIDAGFAIDHLWQPGRSKAVFIVAKKAA